MPKQYEKIRDSYIKKGVPVKKAKTIAAKTYVKLTGKSPKHTGRKE